MTTWYGLLGAWLVGVATAGGVLLVAVTLALWVLDRVEDAPRDEDAP